MKKIVLELVILSINHHYRERGKREEGSMTESQNLGVWGKRPKTKIRKGKKNYREAVEKDRKEIKKKLIRV